MSADQADTVIQNSEVAKDKGECTDNKPGFISHIIIRSIHVTNFLPCAIVKNTSWRMNYYLRCVISILILLLMLDSFPYTGNNCFLSFSPF